MKTKIKELLGSLPHSGKRVLVVGLGISGVETARFFARAGIPLVVIERSDEERYTRTSKFVDAISELRNQGVEVVFGADGEATAEILKSVVLAVLSPGVSLESAIVGALRRRGIACISELELGMELLELPSIVVTGSNGKSTTVTLIHELLRAAGFDSHLCGNVGIPVVAQLQRQHIFESQPPANRILVVEASSYQLEACQSIKPRVGVFLNLSDNHLERHGTLQRYFEAKARLFANQDSSDYAVLNRDDPMVFSLRARVASSIATFGCSASGCEGTTASIEHDGLIRVTFNGSNEEYSISEARLIGRHNRYNMAAAIVAARLVGASREAILPALESFRPLEHRLEFIEHPGRPLFINDSKSTTVAASVAALRAVLQRFPDRSVSLMIGGLAKAGSWEPLMALLTEHQRRFRRIICFGKDANLLASHCRRYGLSYIQAPSLQEATILAARQSNPTDIVLLSPGCASFDEFSDFEHRGTVFKSLVA